MPELQAKAGLLVGEAELLRRGPHRGDLVGGDARLDELDGIVEPLAALPVGVDLGLVGAAHAERAVVARPVAHERVDDVEEGLVARAQQPVGEHVGMRVAPVAGDGVDRLHLLRAELEQQPLGLGHDVALGDAGTQELVDALVDRVDDAGGVVEQRDLLVGLDRPRRQHHLRAVGGRDARAVQGVERDDVGHVDPDLLAGQAVLGQLLRQCCAPARRAHRSRRASPRASETPRRGSCPRAATGRRAGGGAPPSRNPTARGRRCAEGARTARSCPAPTRRCECW